MSLEDLKIGELHDMAKGLDIKGQSTMKKAELIENIKAQTEPTTPISVSMNVPRGQVQPISIPYDGSAAELIASMRKSIDEFSTKLHQLEQNLQVGVVEAPNDRPEGNTGSEEV